jgi:hypothetical protein
LTNAARTTHQPAPAAAHPAPIPARSGIFPYIATIRAQQQALQLADTVKVDMAGYELFYENGQLIHLSKDGQCALGSALAGAYFAYQAGAAPAPSAS